MLPPDQLATIKATVPILQAHGETVTTVFYNNILRDHPFLNAVFNQTNQATGQQAKALANAVLAYAQYIETPAALGPALKHITNKHASLYIQSAHYAVVGQYLLDAFTEVLGSAFTPDIRAAWAAAYTELADIMIAAEQALYSTTTGWTDWRPFTITSKMPESSEISSFVLTPTDNKPLPTYLPGQYISIRIPVPALGYTQTRQYSLSDASQNCQSSNSYRISVKREPGVSVNDTAHPGLVSNVLHSYSPGETVELSHPMGDFTLDSNPTATTSTSSLPTPTSPLILISAGVGVTPLMSMLNSSLSSPAPSLRPITWIQGATNTTKRPFTPHINALSTQPNVSIVRFITQPSDQDVQGQDYDFAGHVDLAKCDEKKAGCLHLTDSEARYFVCGPDGFMDSVREQLVGKGVDGERVQSEKFGTGGF